MQMAIGTSQLALIEQVKPEIITCPLKQNQVDAIIHDFVKGIGLYHKNAPVKASQFQHLRKPFEEIYNVFRNIRETASFVEFADIMSYISKSFGQHESVRMFLTEYKDITIAAYSNRWMHSKDAFVTGNEYERKAKGVLIAIRLGDYLQSMKITKNEIYPSHLVKLASKQNTPFHYEGTIWLSSKTAEAKKTHIVTRWLCSIKSSLIRSITWPFQAQKHMAFSTCVALTFIAGVIASVYFSSLYFHTPAPLKAYAWKVIPSWNTTKSFFKDIIPK